MMLWAMEYPWLTAIIVLYITTAVGVVGGEYAHALSVKYGAKQNDKL